MFKQSFRIVRGSLRPSKSSQERTWSMLIVKPGIFLGRLRIVVRGKAEDYLIDEDFSDAPFRPGFRVFMMARQTGPIDEQRAGLYAVTVSPSKTVSCTCIGDTTRGRAGSCKHADTVRDLLQRGELPTSPENLKIGA